MDRTKLLTTGLLFFALFAVGSFGAAIYFYQERTLLQEELSGISAAEPPTISEAVEAPVGTVSGSPVDSSEEIQALNAYISRLERENASLKEQVSQATIVARSNDENRGHKRRPPSPEEMKARDPERFERMEEGRKRAQEFAQEQQRKRDDFFARLDTSKFTAEQNQTLNDYRETLNELSKFALNREESNLSNPGEAIRNLFAMHDDVQKILLQDLGTRLGTNGDDLVDGVMEVLSVMGATPNAWMRPPQRGR